MSNQYAVPPEKYKFGNRIQPTPKAISDGMRKAKREREDTLHWIKEIESWRTDKFKSELKKSKDGNNDGKSVGYNVAIHYFEKIFSGDFKVLNAMWDRKYGRVGYNYIIENNNANVNATEDLANRIQQMLDQAN